jgi:hypothetical protein
MRPCQQLYHLFSEMAFDALPQCQKWDHTIELEHEPSPGFRKVYVMITLTEQKEMDAFLEEVLATGRIRQSKSPLGTLVLFIKKKDGKLCFVLLHPQCHHAQESLPPPSH